MRKTTTPAPATTHRTVTPRPVDPLAAALRDAAERTGDPLVGNWFRALAESAECASGSSGSSGTTSTTSTADTGPASAPRTAGSVGHGRRRRPA